MIDSAGTLLMSIGSAMLKTAPEGAPGQTDLASGNPGFASLLAAKLETPVPQVGSEALLPAPLMPSPGLPEAPASQTANALPTMPVLPESGKILPHDMPTALPGILPILAAAPVKPQAAAPAQVEPSAVEPAVQPLQAAAVIAVPRPVTTKAAPAAKAIAAEMPSAEPQEAPAEADKPASPAPLAAPRPAKAVPKAEPALAAREAVNDPEATAPAFEVEAGSPTAAAPEPSLAPAPEAQAAQPAPQAMTLAAPAPALAKDAHQPESEPEPEREAPLAVTPQTERPAPRKTQAWVAGKAARAATAPAQAAKAPAPHEAARFQPEAAPVSAESMALTPPRSEPAEAPAALPVQPQVLIESPVQTASPEPVTASAPAQAPAQAQTPAPAEVQPRQDPQQPVTAPILHPAKPLLRPASVTIAAQSAQPEAPVLQTASPAPVLSARMVLEPAAQPTSSAPAAQPRETFAAARELPLPAPAQPQAPAFHVTPQAAPADMSIAAPALPRGETPIDFTQLVDRLVAAREAASPAAVKVSLDHGQFGKVSLSFAPDVSGLSVTMASPNPEFVRAVEAANQAAPLAPPPAETASATGQSARQSDSGMTFAQGQGQSAPRQQSADARASSPRSNSTDTGHEEPGERQARRGIFA